MITQNFWKLLNHLLTEESENYSATNALLHSQALLPSFIDKTPAPLEKKIFTLLYDYIEHHKIAPSRALFFDRMMTTGVASPDESSDLQDFSARLQTRSLPRFSLEDTAQLLEEYEHGRDIYLFQRTVETSYQIFSQPTKVDGKERFGFDDCLDYAQRHLATLGSSQSKISHHRLAEDGEDQYAYYLWEKEQMDSMSKCLTGLSHLDSVINGFRPGEMITLMGYTGDGKCCKNDTLVMADGLQRIEDLWPQGVPKVKGSFIQFQDPKKIPTESGFDYASAIYYGGNSPTVKITLSNGIVFEGTPEHPLRVLTSEGDYKWQRLDQIQIGDSVCLSRKAIPVSTHTHLDLKDSYPDFPQEMTPDLALWLGFMVGDGCYTDSQGLSISFSVHTSELELIDSFETLTHSLFGLTSYKKIYANPNLYTIRVYSSKLRKFLRELDLICPDQNHDKYVPKTILQADPSCWKAFISGLLATDGHVQSNPGNGNNIEFCMKPERLMREVQIMLQSLAVYSNLSPKVVNPRPGNQGGVYWRLTLAKCPELLDVFSYCPLSRKYSAIKTLSINHKGVSASRVGNFKSLAQKVRSERDRLGYKRGSSFVLNPTASQYGYDVAHRLFAQLRSEDLEPDSNLEFIYTNVIPVSVVKIEASEAEVYDLSVPESHTFLANALVSHNTTLCLNLAYQAFLQGRNVVYYTLEMPADDILKRFHIRHAANRSIFAKTPIPASAYLDYKLTDVQADYLFREVIPSFSNTEGTRFGSLRVMEPLDSDLTYEAFKADLLTANAEQQVDMFILDYPNLMNVANDRMDYDKAMSRLYVKLKALCRTFNNGQRLIGIIPTQVNKAGREAAEKNNGEYTLRAINQYAEIPNSSDFVFYIYRDRVLNESSECLIGGLKARRCAPPSVTRCSFLPETGLVTNLASESEPSAGGMCASEDGSTGSIQFSL